MRSDEFPLEHYQSLGWSCAVAGQPTYNGVAILSRSALTDVSTGFPGFDDPQQRVIAATLANGIRLVNFYVVNGQAVGSDKYDYKLRWLAAAEGYLRNELAEHPRLVVLGDFNIAPADADVHDPQLWAGQVLCSEAERAALARLQALGLHDSLRMVDQSQGLYSWWDYRQGAFRRNHGLRIDLLLISEALCGSLTAAGIERTPRTWERPSDHAPVWAEFAVGLG